MEFKLEPVKNQKFEIGRTINLSKCNCEQCDFMNCPKQNYALKMKPKKYSVAEFWEANKEEIIKSKSVANYFSNSLFANDNITDFISTCVSFPKGIWWDLRGDGITLNVKNRSKYGDDFLTRADIKFNGKKENIYYVGYSDRIEKLATSIKNKFNKLDVLLKKEI